MFDENKSIAHLDMLDRFGRCKNSLIKDERRDGMALEMQTIKQQLQSCIAQRDQSAQTFQQCVGAIAVLEEQLKVIVMEEMKSKEEAAKLVQERLKAEHKAGVQAGDAATMDSCQGELNDEVKQQEQVEAPKE